MLAATLLMLAAFAAPAPQERPDRPPQTDQTVDVVKGARLRVENFAGEVIVRTWERDALRVRAWHTSRAKVNVRTTSSGVSVRADEDVRGSVDYEITAPAWMPVRVVGTYNFITIEGAQAEVSAETTRGDVVVRGGTGNITARSITGEVIVEGARGRVTASSVNEGVRIIGASGDITAESNNGSISLTQIRSQNVEVTSINGDIEFEGSAIDRGRFRFTTHDGNVTVAIPETSSVTFVIRTYEGRFSSSLDLSGPPRSEVRRGRRTVYTLNKGTAEMEIETFNGSIRVMPQSAFKPRSKRQD
jgi:DUF4097 and DUF4098 domain-containing protein YvlB